MARLSHSVTNVWVLRPAPTARKGRYFWLINHPGCKAFSTCRRFLFASPTPNGNTLPNVPPLALIERLIACALLLVALFPVFRLACTPNFRLKLRAFPGASRALTLALLGAVAGILALTLFLPNLLRPVAVATALLLIAMWWRARPSHGRARGLPPGSLALLPVGQWTNRDYYEKQAARFGPIFKASHVLKPTICVVGMDNAAALFREHADAVQPDPIPSSRFVQRGFLRYMSDPDHAAYRALFREAFSREVVEQCLPQMTDLALAGILRLANAAPTNDANPQTLGDHIHQIVFEIITAVFHGVSPDSPEFAILESTCRVADVNRAAQTPAAAVREALDRAFATIRTLGETIRRDDAAGKIPQPSFLSQLLDAKPDALDDPAILGNLVFIPMTASLDTAGMLTWAIKLLSLNPRWIERLRTPDPQSPGEPLARRVIRETLRMEQSEYLVRILSRDVRFRGHLLPKGWLLRICTRESHRNSADFVNPDTFDPDRFLTRAHRAASYAPFGLGARACLGEQLTLAIGSIFLTEMAANLDWTISSDGPDEYNGFHWCPSRRFRLKFAKRP
ncbi:MAG: cytochrome P450 [Candidatus Sumerlaeaceae bacterium]|nr:cytochrome P450 [Candidatus Sumerlaeaceae bacterium]